MQYAEKCSQPYDFQICIIHLFLQGKLNNCSCSWSLLCISSLSCSALLPCWEPHREQTPLLWRLMEAWLWKFCLFGFFPLIFDSFSPFITQEKMVFPRKSHSPEHTMSFPFCVQGNAVTHWAWGSHAPEGGKSAGFSKEKTTTENNQLSPSSLTCAAQLKGHRQQRISKPELQLGLSSLPQVTVTPCRAIPAGDLAPRLPGIWSLGVKGHFSQLSFKSSKINKVQEEQEQTFSSSSHCPGGACRGLA